MSDSTSQPSDRAAKSGKFALLSRAIKHGDFILKFFPYRVVNLLSISSVFTELQAFLPKILIEGFKADIAFIDTALACSQAILPQILTFVTRNFIGSCVIRCAFRLVSRKDDCLERVLRKYFWIKKLINKISLHLSNKF